MADIIQIRRDTAANFTAANPVLAQGEPALEIDTLKEKIGDGVSTWANLPYRFSEAGGGGDLNYVHDQGTPATVWTIVHNLNKYPAVTVIDTADNIVEGEVNYTDLNSLTITFNSGFSGKATLN